MNSKFAIIFIITCLCAACSLSEMGDPPLDAGDRWIKEGLNREQVRRAYIKCGYNESNWNMKIQKDIDNCMLSNNFIFIDSPYESVHRQCKDIYPKFQRLPSCQSLRARINN